MKEQLRKSPTYNEEPNREIFKGKAQSGTLLQQRFIEYGKFKGAKKKKEGKNGLPAEEKGNDDVTESGGV